MPLDHDGGMPRVQLTRERRGAQAAAERGDILVVIKTGRGVTSDRLPKMTISMMGYP